MGGKGGGSAYSQIPFLLTVLTVFKPEFLQGNTNIACCVDCE